MKIKKVIAVFDEFRLDDIQKALVSHAVTGFSIHRVDGRGQYYDSFNRNPLVAHVRLETYVNAEYAQRIADVIISVAYVNAQSEGLVAIEPVDELFWIHYKNKASIDDFNYRE